MADITPNADDQRHRAITVPEGNESHSLRARGTTLLASTANPAIMTEHDAQQSPPLSEDVSFPFMKLPLELRNKVYEEFLVLPGSIKIKTMRRKSSQGDTQKAQNLKLKKGHVSNLFATSRAIYHESVPVYFGLNIFYFPKLDILAKFLSKIGPSCRRKIRSISVLYWGKTPAKAAKLLGECIGLRHLTLSFDLLSERCLPRRNRIMMKIYGLKDLLRIRGLGSLRIEVEDIGLLPQHWSSMAFEDLPEFEEAMQVCKQPRSAAQLARQDKKDYPEAITEDQQ